MTTSPFERHGITHLSPSSLNTYAAEKGYWVFKYLHGYEDKGGPAAWRGLAVEAGLDHFLFKRDEGAAQKAALDRFELEAFGLADDETDKERMLIFPMLSLAIEKIDKPEPPTVRQFPVEFWFDGIEVPVIGKVDYEWESEGIDLKTTKRMPGQLSGGHARQISLYQAARRKPYRVFYVTEKKAEFKSLTDDEAKTHLKHLEWHAHSIRRVLSMFTCKHELARIFIPDFEHFYWRREETRVAAMEIWHE